MRRGGRPAPVSTSSWTAAPTSTTHVSTGADHHPCRTARTDCPAPRRGPRASRSLMRTARSSASSVGRRCDRTTCGTAASASRSWTVAAGSSSTSGRAGRTWGRAGGASVPRGGAGRAGGRSRWDVGFGGVVAVGEDWETAAHRELVEEAGVEADLTYLGEATYEDDDVALGGRLSLARHDGPFHFA